MDRAKVCSILEEYKDRLTITALARKEEGDKRFCISGACLYEAGVPFDMLMDKPVTLYSEIPLDDLPDETVEILEDYYGADQLRAGWGEATIKLFGILAAVYGMNVNERQQIMEVNDFGGFGDDESDSHDVYASLHRFLRCDEC